MKKVLCAMVVVLSMVTLVGCGGSATTAPAGGTKAK
jgi:hypothetical protein